MDHLDAVFAIDLSAQADLVLNNQKGLLKRLVNQVQRSSDLNNVGLISYTSSAKVEIPLSQNRYDFNALVDSLQKKNGYRAIDRAILTAHERIFLPKHKELNAKPTFNQKLPKKLFVLFTSGGHVDNVNSVLPEDAARLLYDLDVEILVVAFNSTNEDVINIVRGNKENFYTYRDGGVLGIWNYICDTFGTKKTVYDCTGAIDINILLDSSASMRLDYQLQVAFIEKLVDRLGLARSGPHASLVAYSNKADTIIDLKDGHDSDLFKNRISMANFEGKDSRFDRAFYLARVALFDPKRGARNNVPKVVLFITDGKHTNKETTALDMAEELKDLGVQIIVVAIGGGVDEEMLREIATSNESIYFEQSFNNLLKDDVISGMYSGMCARLGPSQSYIIPGVVPETGSVIIGGNKIPVPAKEGKCVHPLSRDISMMAGLMDAGMSPSWVGKFYSKTGTLPNVVSHYKKLQTVMEKLAPALKENGVIVSPGVEITGQIGTCKSFAVEATLSAVLCDDKSKKDMFTIAREHGGNHFVDLLWASGLANGILSSKDDITLIIPHDRSWKELSQSFREKLKDSCYLREVLKYHIVPDKVSETLLASMGAFNSLNSKLSIFVTKTSEGVHVNGNLLETSDIESKEGFVHVVGSLLIPPSSFDEIVGQENTLLLKGLSNMKNLLNNQIGYTFFIPTPAAYNNLQLPLQLQLNSNESELMKFTQRHVVNGLIFVKDDNIEHTFKDMSGSDITVVRQNGVMVVNGNIEVVGKVMTNRGIIYYISDIIDQSANVN